ncbi:MAG: type IIA DNA topoisomerase subunit B [Paludibacteraceae bacterium]|jgi:topoisomerase-4 subunit B|nr:type IIA DNA topoisomerase subunit B [Bacteroidales bacterium]MBP3466475.1 type IIA DNA topoisomerase subunit B [Paludibacteraceae bacterium]MBQ3681200.1 type IIA DNA topoisomerase subunit B [Paludibacteraceae bacterium]MBQ6962307.1 type IIA DNA topoisomerase subunit B [Paludibacteraceae bacterium]MBQ7748804.1 type IIA DNA topoisomerase subunit B [Paludibacteraceae bacterium]
MANDEELLNGGAQENAAAEYTDDNIVTLEGLEHVRLRPGMYIGKLGDGNSADDGIYVLLKEVIDNSIDEFRMHFGTTIDIKLDERTLTVRDYGRGIPQGKMVAAVSIMNTGAKYDTKSFQKSVGLNGVGTKAVNALSSNFSVWSFRDGKVKQADFEAGKLVKEYDLQPTTERDGTMVRFTPDETVFGPYKFHTDYIETMLRNYTYLNTGLTLVFNGQKFVSRNGLLDLLQERNTAEPLYPIVHLKGEDIEIAFTHTDQYGEDYYSFVNGQYTTQGGTHQSALREHLSRAIKDFYQKNFELSDIRSGIVATIAINVIEPTFESQTKVKLGSANMAPDKDSEGKPYDLSGVSVNKFVGDFIKKEVDDFLHKNQEIADTMLHKIQESEKERKAIAGVTKLAREKAKKANLHNRKLRDCRYHFNDTRVKDEAKNELMENSSIFITEGDSASGSLTKCRNVDVQAVFSLRGKPLNSWGLSKKVVYENDEFNLLQAALNIEDGLDGLRYNKVIIATDADVDGMHIRLLMLTFFLQFYPELVKRGHVYILETPLFRVRKTGKNGADDRYCYSEDERLEAIEALKPNPEITRFKGLGEISPDEFKGFIGDKIRLDQVKMAKGDLIGDVLEFYMGKNTPSRQDFIIDNLVVQEDML